MKPIATTRLSSKGQVVIPEEIRSALNLHEGDQFVVMGENDYVILKIITPPSIEEFDYLIDKTRAQARKLGLQKEDIHAAIKKARKK
jgi:AbrB family looped-hinge helix DNA binding protein